MPLAARLFIAFGALAAATAVALGAAASHVPAVVQAAANPSFVTALQLHQVHALGLIGVGLVAAHLPTSRWVLVAGILLIAGLLLFSGNLYLRTLADIDSFRRFVPWGGSAWIFGWLALAIGAMTGKSAR